MSRYRRYRYRRDDTPHPDDCLTYNPGLILIAWIVIIWVALLIVG